MLIGWCTSLGISLLELACDVNLPSGGEGWHLLRRGQIPPHLTKGWNAATVLGTLCQHVVFSVDLSPELVSILIRMMHPDPKLRPTVDEILADPSVAHAGYQHSCYKASYWVLSSCKHLLGRILAVVMFIFTMFPGE